MNRVRTILFTAWLTLATLAISLVGWFALFFGEGAALRVVKVWAHAALFGLRAICGIRHVVEGRALLPRGGAIVAANHQSMWETIVFMTLLERPAMVFKKELLRVPVYGWWGRRAGSIPVDRDGGARAIRDLAAIAGERIADGRQVILFPEGTRMPVGEAAPLQPGIAAVYMAGGAPCSPALHDSGRFWRFPGGLTSLKVPGVITLRILPPIEAGLARKEFQRRLEAALAPRGKVRDAAAPGDGVTTAEGRAA